jgi:hypothetical protein
LTLDYRTVAVFNLKKITSSGGSWKGRKIFFWGKNKWWFKKQPLGYPARI